MLAKNIKFETICNAYTSVTPIVTVPKKFIFFQ